jgi:hypothetical protein
MPPPIERQTLIALKSRRTAFRVVSDFLHRGKLNASDFACKACGAPLEDRPRDGEAHLCRRCAERVAQFVPEALVYEDNLAERAERDFSREYFGFIVFMIVLVVGIVWLCSWLNG